MKKAIKRYKNSNEDPVVLIKYLMKKTPDNVTESDMENAYRDFTRIKKYSNEDRSKKLEKYMLQIRQPFDLNKLKNIGAIPHGESRLLSDVAAWGGRRRTRERAK